MAGQQNIVIHYLDGRVLKGHTTNFSPVANYFMLRTLDMPANARGVVVEIKSVKAVFFVKDFIGSASYAEKKTFSPTQPYQGRKVRVTFSDGEVMVGATPNYDANMQGFFIFPADLNANTIKIFASAAAVKSMEYVDGMVSVGPLIVR